MEIPTPSIKHPPHSLIKILALQIISFPDIKKDRWKAPRVTLRENTPEFPSQKKNLNKRQGIDKRIQASTHPPDSTTEECLRLLVNIATPAAG